MLTHYNIIFPKKQVEISNALLNYFQLRNLLLILTRKEIII